MFYDQQRSPTQSTTSLSGDEDDDLNRSTFFPPTEPAAWSSRNPRSAVSSLAAGRGQIQRSLRPQSVAANLPPELLINIFKHLSSASDMLSALLVSRSWCECSVELLWHKPSLPDFRSLMKIVRAMSRDDASFAYASFIRRLNFSAVAKDLTDPILARLHACVRLERLTLVGCSGLSDPALAQALSRFTELVAVDLSYVHSVTDATVHALAAHCPKLQGVNLLGCKHVSPSSVSALAQSCNLLRRVKLSGISDLDDEPVSTLAQNAPLVLEIDLGGCKYITDVPVRDIWTYSSHMRELRLAGCERLTNAAFPAPAHLQSIEPDPSDADALPPLRLRRSYDQLRLLDLTGCAKLTDDAIEGIIAAAPRLRNLALTKCKGLTDRAIEAICALGKNLHYVHLGHVAQITDRSVKSLARSCTRLRYIDLASTPDCHNLTDMSVFEIASLPKLRRVGLVRVPNLTDEAIYALGEQHQCLERVHLSYCDQVTVMAVHFLLQKLGKLNHLSLTGVPAFRKQELQAFCRSPPPEFSTPQRQAFCVYSGEGVKALRSFLAELFNSMSDDAEQGEYGDEEDDGEGEDVYDGDGDVEGDDGTYRAMDEDPQPLAVPHLPSQYHQRPHQHQHPPQHPHQHPVQALPPIPGPSRIPHPAYPTPNTSTPTTASSTTTTTPANPTPISFPAQHQQVPPPHPRTDSHSPTPSDVSAGGTFFRTFTLDERARHGALTPELVFAEIGHGRGVWVEPGTNGPGTAVGTGTMAPAPHQPPPSAPVFGAFPHPGHTPGSQYTVYNGAGGPPPRSAGVNGSFPPGASATGALPRGANGAHGHGHTSNANGNGIGANGVFAPRPSANGFPPPNGGDPGINGVLVAGHSSNGAERGRPGGTKALHESAEGPGAAGSSGSGRDGAHRGGVKRALRNTFSAVEHHASSFFFGRATHEDAGVESSRER